MMVTNYLSWTVLYSAEQVIGKSRRKESAHRQKRGDDRGLWANRWQQWEVSGLRGRLRVAETKTAWEVRRGWVERSGCETRQIHLPNKEMVIVVLNKQAVISFTWLGHLSICVVISFAECPQIPHFLKHTFVLWWNCWQKRRRGKLLQFSVFLSFLIWYCSPYLWVA